MGRFFAPVWLSVKIAVLTSIIVFLLAVLAARKMAGRRFFGHNLVETVLLLPLVLPPTVVGFVLLVVLGRRSWIGRLYEQFTEQTILFTWGRRSLPLSWWLFRWYTGRLRQASREWRRIWRMRHGHREPASFRCCAT